MKKKEFEERYGTERYREFREKFFDRIPAEILPYLSVKQFLRGEIMISSAHRSEAVYFLMEGTVRAVDDRVQSLPYVFAELTPVEIMGDYELFSRMEGSYATIVAAADCRCIAMPADLYLQWILRDGEALFYRTSLLMNQLGGQAVASRQYFFLDYGPRCASVFLRYAAPDAREIFVLRISRENLAARMGCSLRTCHRVVGELKKMGLVSVERGKIVADGAQREKLEAYLKAEMEKI